MTANIAPIIPAEFPKLQALA